MTTVEQNASLLEQVQLRAEQVAYLTQHRLGCNSKQSIPIRRHYCRVIVFLLTQSKLGNKAKT